MRTKLVSRNSYNKRKAQFRAAQSMDAAWEIKIFLIEIKRQVVQNQKN